MTYYYAVGGIAGAILTEAVAQGRVSPEQCRYVDRDPHDLRRCVGALRVAIPPFPGQEPFPFAPPSAPVDSFPEPDRLPDLCPPEHEGEPVRMVFLTTACGAFGSKFVLSLADGISRCLEQEHRFLPWEIWALTDVVGMPPEFSGRAVFRDRKEAFVRNVFARRDRRILLLAPERVASPVTVASLAKNLTDPRANRWMWDDSVALFAPLQEE